MLPEIIHVTVPRTDQRARRPGNGLDGRIVREQGPAKRPDHAGRVFIGLDGVSEASVVSAPPGEYAGHVFRRRRRRFDGEDVILPATDRRESDAPGIFQGYDFGFSRTGGGGGHSAFFEEGVLLALDEIGAAQEFGAVGVGESSGGDDVFAGFAVAELAPFGGAGGVEVSFGAEEGGDVFSAGCLGWWVSVSVLS